MLTVFFNENLKNTIKPTINEQNKTEKDIDKENKFMVAKGEGVGG